jgi:two-component system, OmpR family, phosphate regulon response regulator PhoB
MTDRTSGVEISPAGRRRVPGPCRCTSGAHAVLLVDPDPHLRDIFTALFAFHGYPVVAVASGEEALQCARSCRFCAVVLEMEIADGSGLAVARRLREDPATAEVALVVTTSRSGLLARRQAWQVGSHGYLEKPFFPRDLLAEVERVLSSWSAVGESGGGRQRLELLHP